MTLRSSRERIIQTLSFEAGGLLLVTPVDAVLFGSSMQHSLTLILCISVAVMLWSPLVNLGFDRLRPVRPNPSLH